MKTLLKIFILGLLVLLAISASASCSNSPEPPIGGDENGTTTPDVVPVYDYQIINVYPHDRDAFTQGLVFDEGVLYEGTGLYKHSTLRRVNLETGEVLQSRELPPDLFGEGITVFGNKIIQLTWRSNVGFVYDKYSFELLDEFKYPTEGWGITHDGNSLIISDGTSRLYLYNPETLQNTGCIEVYDNYGPVYRLNELEYVQGEIYANIWQTDYIARISPQTGQVTGLIELEGLLNTGEYGDSVDVLNGIAYDVWGDRLFVTGKWWPKLFEIKLTNH